MKRLPLLSAFLLVLVAFPALAGETFPDLPLTGALPAAQRGYLGVGEGNKPSDIPADYLLVQVFSMYCPICQRDAPNMNALYEKIVSGELGQRIRVFAIGAGNTPFEIDFYREKFGVGFPLFNDQEYVYHKALGEIGTPAFYLFDRSSMEILYFQEGEIDNVDDMLAILAEKTVGKEGRP